MTEPIDGVLFASLDPLQLAGSRCRGCDTVQFPPRAQCAHCAGTETDTISLPEHGEIWTWTVQRFPPKPPYVIPDSGFEPYGVGYVNLGEVLVESTLMVPDARLTIGLHVELVPVPVSGDPIHFTYGFAA